MALVEQKLLGTNYYLLLWQALTYVPNENHSMGKMLSSVCALSLGRMSYSRSGKSGKN